MVKKVTFSFNQSISEDTKATETFTFEELEINKNVDEKTLKKELEKKFQAWVWNKLNISYSIVIEESSEK